MNPFTPLIGQPQAVELLTQAVAKNRIAPAYLFTGTPGIGKVLGAKCFIELIFADSKQQQTINNHPDLFWVEPTYQHQGQRLTIAEATAKGLKRKAPPVIRLEQIREITQFLSRPPLKAPRQVVVLSDVDKMAEAGANALLKTLEEPGKATLILIAPSPDSILSTLVSRCQRIPFYSLDTQAMVQVLQQTGHEEILQHPTILNIAAGSPGKALAYHQQLQNIPSELLAAVTEPPRTYRQALEIAKQIDKSLDTETQLWLIDYLQQFYWQNGCQPAIIQEFEQARKSLLCYAQPRLVWECTFLKMYV
ncbi:MAG: AAA family ATPase [Richelia sp.]|nr:AAA family ATPase [Richelia sp.]CDN12838.1 DNA polymerase III delta prime subunit [Richelia intracellularis]